MLLSALTLALLAAPPSYDAQRAALERTRQALAAKARTELPSARTAARAALLTFFDDAVFPSWAGTPWDFNGTTQVPGQGVIACGYYVSTTLLHAGLRVERIRLAQQFSTDIVRTLATDAGTVILRRVEPAVVLERARALAPGGLLVVGLDNHVGFLRVKDEGVRFCHANYVGDGGVTCEDPLTSSAFHSSTYVLGDAFPPVHLDAWLRGTPIATTLTRSTR